MAFMELPVQLPVRVKVIVILFWCWVALPGCVYTKTNEGTKENVSIYKSDTALRKQGGFLLYNQVKFNGQIVEISPQGDTLYKCQYINGKQEGTEILKYSNGQLSEVRYYKNGYKEGEHKGWYENGIPRFIYNYKNDIYEGNVKDWGTNGQLYRDFNYKNGQESGRQRMWYDDGRIRANYDVKKGRKYGLTGVKNCVNVTEEK